jgi:acyl carrier protein
VEIVREILNQHGRMSVDQLGNGDSLYAAGLTSLATVGVMLALEDRFDIEFPESMLSRATFASIDTITAAVTQFAG